MASGVGEMLASAVVKEVVKTLSSSLWKEIGLLCNFRNDLEDMKGTLVTLEAVLYDAEKRSGRADGAVERLWLKRLKLAVYDVKELFTSYESKIPVKKEKSLDNMVQNLRIFFSGTNPVISTVKMAHKIKGLRKRLNNIAAEHVKFNFVKGVSYVEQDEIDGRATNSLLDQNYRNTILGREEEKKKLVHLLLDENVEGDFGIISIVGFGGLGKTTLAQLLFNEERIKGSFDLRAWVYVSMNFDFKKIVENIIESITGNSKLYTNEDAACRELRGLLKDKRFLIVLDDFWEEDREKMDKLKITLQGCMKSSKIILTTRNEKIATLIGSTQLHFIKLLTDEHCWVLFSRRAFRSDVERGNQELVEIGKEIVKKCKGVPLVAQALGFTMLSKVGVNSWKSVRDSDLWELEDKSGSSGAGILPSLKLSYYNMPSYLKICFAYLSIFSKGSYIYKNELIQQWIALGFIQKNKQNIKLEEVGKEYINNLIWMSFLQTAGESGLQMHDLVHDLATSIAEDETLICIDGKKNNVNTACTQYVQLADYKDSLIRSEALPQKMKSLHIMRCGPGKLHDRIFSEAKFLQVLSLDACQINTFPKSFDQLKRLRHLNCSNLSNITTLPDSLGNLHNLQFLILWCLDKLITIPESICGLVNLKLLLINGCAVLNSLPEGLCHLKSLKCLEVSICAMRLLPQKMQLLTSLERLELRFCAKLTALPESIGSLISLKRFSLIYCMKLVALPDTLGNLATLEVLNISFCDMLMSLPRNIGSLVSLKRLNISNCKKLAALPDTFGNLATLEVLNISVCYMLMSLPRDMNRLTRLNSLSIRGSWEFEECWRGLGEGWLKNITNCYIGPSTPTTEFNQLDWPESP